jgi:hypothetical protein
MSEVKVDTISERTAANGVAVDGVTIKDSGLTIPSSGTLTIDSGGTITNNGTASGFGSPAYASNASATDNTVNVDASDNLQFNSGYGSTVTAYGCRAWVNFNGSGTLAIRSSGNVSSVTDNGTGDYTVNFTNSMPDDNYSVSICCNHPSSMVSPLNTARGNLTTSAFHIYTLNASFSVNDAAYVLAQIIR